jgi:hypothetical protein
MTNEHEMKLGGRRSLVAGMRVGIAALLAMIGLGLSTSADGAEADSRKGACKAPTVVDFTKVLEQMRPPARVPARERLPFAPPGIHLSGAFRTSVGPRIIGFTAYRNGGSFIGQRGWRVNSRLTLVRRSGAPLRVVQTKEQTFDPIMRGKVDSTQVGAFRASSHIAFYRVDMEFQHRRSGRHYRYRDYYRVLPARRDLRLTLSDTSLEGGERLFWRLENFGTIAAIYGLSYVLERFDGSSGGWVVDPLTPSGFVSVGFWLGAGSAGECESLSLPAGMAAGHYRLVKNAQFGLGPEHILTSDFSVAGPAG